MITVGAILYAIIDPVYLRLRYSNGLELGFLSGQYCMQTIKVNNDTYKEIKYLVITSNMQTHRLNENAQTSLYIGTGTSGLYTHQCFSSYP